jgi:hypothetical protein
MYTFTVYVHPTPKRYPFFQNVPSYRNILPPAEDISYYKKEFIVLKIPLPRRRSSLLTGFNCSSKKIPLPQKIPHRRYALLPRDTPSS